MVLHPRMLLMMLRARLENQYDDLVPESMGLCTTMFLFVFVLPTLLIVVTSLHTGFSRLTLRASLKFLLYGPALFSSLLIPYAIGFVYDHMLKGVSAYGSTSKDRNALGVKG